MRSGYLFLLRGFCSLFIIFVWQCKKVCSVRSRIYIYYRFFNFKCASFLCSIFYLTSSNYIDSLWYSPVRISVLFRCISNNSYSVNRSNSILSRGRIRREEFPYIQLARSRNPSAFLCSLSISNYFWRILCLFFFFYCSLLWFFQVSYRVVIL